MKYLCLVYLDEQPGESQNVIDFDAIADELLEFSEHLRGSGHFIAAAPLQPAATIRVWNGRVSVADSSFAEPKVRLSAFFVIEARDLNDAIRVAAKLPSPRLGTIEVRPIFEPDHSRCDDNLRTFP